MKPPMVIERYGGLVFVPFKAAWRGMKWVGREVFSPGGDYFFIAWICFVVGIIASMFLTGAIRIEVEANESQIRSAYQEVLHRPADEAGLQGYLKSGLSESRVKADLEASAEKKALDSKPTDK